MTHEQLCALREAVEAELAARDRENVFPMLALRARVERRLAARDDPPPTLARRQEIAATRSRPAGG